MGETWTDTKQSAMIAGLPYVAMLIGALIGIAAGGFIGRPTVLYWQLLILAYALVCVIGGWERDASSAERIRLITKQAIDWRSCSRWRRCWWPAWAHCSSGQGQDCRTSHEMRPFLAVRRTKVPHASLGRSAVLSHPWSSNHD